MKISAKAEYACLSVIELARSQAEGRPRRVREIAEAQGIPERYLVQILLLLKAAGLVQSTRGAVGGYALTRPAAEITVADVVAVIDGPGDPPRRAVSPAGRDLGDLLARARDAGQGVLAEARIAEMAGPDPLADYVL
ncbi:RrF2 family transcriptional regulator [Tundrisphaera sp. TA3]|uniref:RrF2 family transcriptional regulator n=1 Tax=Tundrisphaera sp. TA3 TaxID=3435775 RepID=UPI003EB9EAB6